MNAEQLTIGFPTYMRRDAIVARLTKILGDPNAKNHPILVIDNGSTDGTFEAVQAQCNSARVTLLRNESNIGIVRNITRLFRECQTDYLLLMSDEDELLSENLPGLLELIGEFRPAFVSPQALNGSTIYRGVTESGPIAPADFNQCSFYISGLVYHRETTGRSLARLEAMEAVNTAGRLYPLGVLAVPSILAESTYWYGQPIASKAETLPTYISDKGGEPYAQVPSRWRQHIDWLKYFDDLEQDGLEEKGINAIKEMRDAQYRGLYARILRAIEYECPASATAFRLGAQRAEKMQSARAEKLEAKVSDLRERLRRRDEEIARLKAKRSAHRWMRPREWVRMSKTLFGKLVGSKE